MKTGSTPIESTSYSSWTSTEPPHRVLMIRMHAIGDVAITLPMLAGFMKGFPDARVDFLTTQACASLFDSLSLRGDVLTFPDKLNRWGRLRRSIQFGLQLHSEHYDVVIDLQRNWVSRLIRRLCSPRAWGEFERFTPESASQRVLTTFRSAGFQEIEPVLLPMKTASLNAAKEVLLAAGWNGTSRLVVLNPAGLWETRQWPIENYVDVAKRILKEEETRFVLLGTGRVRHKAQYIKEHLGAVVIDLVERTTLGEALAVLQYVNAMVTEDSGLMHMAWASGIPMVSLFGSTNHVWSSPTGNLVRSFDSGDLPCGACMEPVCKHGDIHCLTRVTPEMVHMAMNEILAAKQNDSLNNTAAYFR